MSRPRPWKILEERPRADFSVDEQRSLFHTAADSVDDPVDHDMLHAAGEIVWFAQNDRDVEDNEYVTRWLDQLWKDFV